MLLKSNKFYYLICCSILNAAALFSNIYLNKQQDFFFLAVLFFFGGLYLVNNSPFQNKYIRFILVFGLYPTLLFISFIGSFFFNGYLGYPIVMIVGISICSVFIVKSQSKNFKLKYSITFLCFTLLGAAFLPNYYHYISHVHNQNTGLELPDINVYDSDRKKVDFKNMNDNIYVIDIWNSSCGVCIKEFPKFEQLKDEFKNDPSIKFYTLNLPLKRDIRQEIDSYTNPYTFDKLYADDNVSKQLNINLIPQYMIIDKNSRIQYIGSLHTGKLDFYKNFYTIINNIKNEK